MIQEVDFYVSVDMPGLNEALGRHRRKKGKIECFLWGIFVLLWV